ncbi:MAG: hypothetical protein JWP97_3102 [Labilithrix sp.]|nr:hypothetical protein [Labilithrix sp.]
MQRPLALGLVAVGAAVVLLLGSGSRGGGHDDADAGAPASGEGRQATSTAGNAAATAAAQPAPAEPQAPPDDPRFAQRAERVSQALALLRYAPGSQPLRKDMTDVLQPNRRHETPHPLSFANGGAAGTPQKPEDLSYELTGNVYTVLPGASLDATLEVFRTSASGARERVAVDVSDLGVRLVEAGGDRQVNAPLAMNDDGNHVYSLHLAPSSIGELAGRRGLARLDVGFVAAEGDRRPARASLDFRLAGSVPATFTGVSEERLTGEGLEISVDLEVTEPGRYFVQGLLFDARHEPIGLAVARPTLAAGHAKVALLYFGLLFREANASGPYVFETLTGQRMPADNEPDRADLAPWTGSYRTKAYALTDFSDQEYESAAKDAKLQALSDLAAAGGKSSAHLTAPPTRR